jgi:para-nitrobenzyl esterase
MGIIVETTHGNVEGVEADRHQFFKGIPFAAAPVGDRRFTAPQPPEAWTGVLATSEFGASSLQPPSLLPGMAAGPQDEDCLYLNVYTPAADAKSRPVMVWVHGGGFTGGSGSQALYEGASFATRGDIVLVTINYRLGVLGYLDLARHADQLEGAASNLGQLDQIAALEWVRDNIEAFGGDPSQVTIFGESAGGMAVSSLMAMPGAKGLFRGVIAQSGAAHATLSKEDAATVVEALLDELGIASDEVGKLREISGEEILEAQVRAGARVAANVFLPFAPVIDAASMPTHPLEFIREGGAKDIALLVGCNRDEWKLFSVMNKKHFEIDDAALPKVIASRLHKLDDADPASIIDIYRGERPEAPAWGILDAIESDRLFRIPAIRLAEAQSAHQESTFKYFFTWPSPARRGLLGSCHAIELAFVFGTLDAPTMNKFAGEGPEAEALSETVMDAWVAFARTGNPNCKALPDWSRYTSERRSTMVLDRVQGMQDAPCDPERAAWDELL